MNFYKVALLAGWVLLTVQAMAQEQVVRYINKRGGVVAKAKAEYYEIISINKDSSAVTNRYTLDSLKVRTVRHGNYYDGQLIPKRHGLYQEWYENGQKSEEANYLNNKLEGKQTTWFKNGIISYERNYTDGVLQDTLKGYYENGTRRRIEVYEKGNLISGDVYAKNGIDIVPFFPYQQMPQFPNGEQAMYSFIGNTLKYPESAIKKNVEGTVYVTFVVTKRGKITDIELLKGVHPDIDTETIRVMKAMPNWEPGRLEGELVAIRYNIPVKFTLK